MTNTLLCVYHWTDIDSNPRSALYIHQIVELKELRPLSPQNMHDSIQGKPTQIRFALVKGSTYAHAKQILFLQNVE